MGEELEYIFLQRRCTSGQQTHEKMLNISLNHQGKANQLTVRYHFLLNRMEVNNNSNSSGKQEMWNEVLIGNATWLNLQNIILGTRRQKNSHISCIISCILNVLNHQVYRKQFFWLHWVFIAVCELSLVAASRGYSLAVVHRLLTVMPSLVAEQFPGAWLSAVVVHQLSCSKVHGILVPAPGIEPLSPALAGGFLTIGPPGKSPESWLASSCHGLEIPFNNNSLEQQNEDGGEEEGDHKEEDWEGRDKDQGEDDEDYAGGNGGLGR